MNVPTNSTRVPHSMALYARATKLIPGATQLISRRPSRVAYGVSPVYAARAKGPRFWDVDGFEYIDWISGIGAILLGYADPVVDDAVREQIATGTIYSVNHELEIELAEELCRAIPCAEMVRYAKCGGEACAMAVRIARGVTGRDKVLFCGYHGWHDWYLAANLAEEASLNAHLFPGIEPIGVPRALAGTALPFANGDLAALGELLERHRGEVAAVIMEPLRSEIPPDGYLAGVGRLAREHGAVFIFDEVSSGLRFSTGGAQQFLGVTPDMAVFAKSLSNGYPMAAVVGKREVMEPAARMFISSTYWSDTIGLRAALTTLREVRRRDVPSQLWRFGHELKSSFECPGRGDRSRRAVPRHRRASAFAVRRLGPAAQEPGHHAVHSGNGQTRLPRLRIVLPERRPGGCRIGPNHRRRPRILHDHPRRVGDQHG